jgi:hypothetical protein
MLPVDPAARRTRIRRRMLAVLLLLAIAAGANAVMDTLSFRYERSIFACQGPARAWLDPQLSWGNKWRNGEPAQGENFPLSSTALVALTDAWHLAKAVMLLSLLLAILLPWTLLVDLPWWHWLGVLLGLKLLWGAVFEGAFGWLLLRG